MFETLGRRVACADSAVVGKQPTGRVVADGARRRGIGEARDVHRADKSPGGVRDTEVALVSSTNYELQIAR